MKKNIECLSFDDERARQISKVLSNETAKKILVFLSEKEAPETEIAKKLNLALSTVHYNIQELQKVQLVSWTHYQYSTKGKEIKLYKAANRTLIIAPNENLKKTFMEKLDLFFPSFLITLAGIIFLELGEKKREKSLFVMQEEAADTMMEKSISFAASNVEQASSFFSSQTFFFLLTICILLLLYVLFRKLTEKKRKEK